MIRAALARWLTPPSADRAARVPAVRRYEGAGGGRRLASAGSMPSLAEAILAHRGRLASRARYGVANNALAASGASAWVSGLVGSGIKAQSAHPDRATRETINAAHESWVDRADADGLRDLYQLQAAFAHSLVVNGESFAALVSDPDTGEARVKLLDPEQIDSFFDRDLDAGNRIVAGIELDRYGRRVAYHILRDTYRFERVRVPASEVVHVFRADAPGQQRGVSWFAPVILKLFEHDKASDALGMRLQISAMLMGVTTNANGDGTVPFDGVEDGRGGLEGGIEPGTIKSLQPGEDIRWTDPPSLGAESIGFLTATAHEIAAGLGIPFEALTGDLSQVNYSSIRAGLVEWRRKCEALQHGVLALQALRPIYRRFVTTEVLRGALAAPGFESDPEPWLGVRFMPPRNDWVDPAKDVQAERDAIAAGLMSRRQAVAARGYDLEALDQEIADDNARAASLGLSFAAPAPAAQGVTP
jgi:lambda family phage portal protein